MNLAIFDLDNTLLDGDSDHAWGEFLVEQKLVDEAAYQEANDYFYQQYKNGSLDIYEFLDFSLKPLARYSKSELDNWHMQFMQSHVQPMQQDKAFALLEQHRKAGDYLLIITATNRFVTKPIADWLGVDDIIATDPEYIDGRYTGKVSGTPCFQAGKIARLEAWLKDHPELSLEGSFFYSDSHNDLPLLKLVDNPVAVNADETLSRYAQEHNWPQLNLRNPA